MWKKVAYPAKKNDICSTKQTKEDLYALLIKVPILDDFSEEMPDGFEKKEINLEIFEKYCEENMTEKGIKLIRRYYGIVAKK